jgi:predicted nucleotidyltransferase
MRLEEALRILKEHREEIPEFGVTSLSVLGSVARNEARPESDVNILVEFGVPMGYFGLARLQRYLEGLLGRKVDLATVGALREKMREQVLREAVRAA